MWNKLLGLRYKFGARPGDGNNETDCFALVCEARRELKLHDYEADFQWAYKREQCRSTVKAILRQLSDIALEVTESKDGDVALVSINDKQLGLGTVISNGYLTIRQQGSSFWTPRLKPIKIFRMNCDN